jgi:glucoamylase
MITPDLPQGTAPPASWSNPTWAPAAKDAVGAALGPSRLWFTIAQGIVTEVYSPRVDIPQLKDLGFIVADGDGAWYEVRRLGAYDVIWEQGMLPAITIVHRHARFTLTLRICADPEREVLLIRHELVGDEGLELYVLATPRIGENVTQNRAWTGDWSGKPVLWAEQGPFGLALASVDDSGACGFLQRSVGCVGESDGWQDFNRHGAMRSGYAQAGPGEVALTARLARNGTLALGISSSREAAATLALQSLFIGFEASWSGYCDDWRRWVGAIEWPQALGTLLDDAARTLLHRSAVVIKCHADKTFPGALVASLSVPWGEASNSRGGYHLVWSRDLVESAGALLALGCIGEARRVLAYLAATQQADGHWLQNQWLGGKPFWQGIQLDETAFPVLLASALAEAGGPLDGTVSDMVRRALSFIVRQGPSTGQDRWEEDAGLNSFTLAVAIAALVEGARFLSPAEADCALMLADAWNVRLEDWTWASGTQLAQNLNVAGYYMRSAPESVLVHDGTKNDALLIKNRAQCITLPASEQLAIDCLQLSRFGLRSASSPQMTASTTAIDALLKVDTPLGPVWHRYNGDGYGEHPDGAPFDGAGVGRGWPLLTGERGHQALLAGDDVRPYLHAMSRMTGPGGLVPEQVWDSPSIPERGLHPGAPSGSAMPLVWAHAEFVKLALSAARGAPVDRPLRTWARYRGEKPVLPYGLWQPRQRIATLRGGQELRLLLPEAARVHYALDTWQAPVDLATQDQGLAHVARIPGATLKSARKILFTLYWPARDAWQGEDFEISILAENPT